VATEEDADAEVELLDIVVALEEEEEVTLPLWTDTDFSERIEGSPITDATCKEEEVDELHDKCNNE
jgi:hypothetical protein